MDFKIIGKNIRERRKITRLTQKQLAERIGRTESSIQKYEAGKVEIPFNVLEDIASTLGVEIIELMDEATVMQVVNNTAIQRGSYLVSLGYQDDYDPYLKFVTIKYNGYAYKVPEVIEYFALLDDIDYKVHDMIGKFLEAHAIEKTICDDYTQIIKDKVKTK